MSSETTDEEYAQDLQHAVMQAIDKLNGMREREGENLKNIAYDESNHPIILTSGESQIHRRYDQFGEIGSVSTDGNITEVLLGYDYVGNLNAKLQNDVYYKSLPLYYIFLCRKCGIENI